MVSPKEKIGLTYELKYRNFLTSNFLTSKKVSNSMKIRRVKVVVYRRQSEKRIKGSSLMVINPTMKERTL